jgi:hypothetical protein
MNLASIAASVETRLTGDTGSGGTVNVSAPLVNSIQNNYAADDAPPPFIVYDVEVEASDAFTRDGLLATITINVYVTDEPGAYTTASAILDRIKGDAISNGTGVPTYGLHRYIIPASGDTAQMGLVYDRGFVQREDGVYHFVEQYKTFAVTSAHL